MNEILANQSLLFLIGGAVLGLLFVRMIFRKAKAMVYAAVASATGLTSFGTEHVLDILKR